MLKEKSVGGKLLVNVEVVHQICREEAFLRKRSQTVITLFAWKRTLNPDLADKSAISAWASPYRFRAAGDFRVTNIVLGGCEANRTVSHLFHESQGIKLTHDVVLSRQYNSNEAIKNSRPVLYSAIRFMRLISSKSSS